VAVHVVPYDGGLVFDALESAAGDLDGDGDSLDQVLHALDFESGLVRNLGIPGAPLVRVGDDVVAWSFEAHEWTDFNQDGDLEDEVLFRWDAASEQLDRLAIEGYPLAAVGDHLVAASRHEEDEDLNGDGDTLDQVAFLSRTTPAAPLVDLELAVPVTGAAVPEHDELLPLLVNESAQGGADLNGDGDSDDAVLVIVRQGG
jgi:hypothetical protein